MTVKNKSLVTPKDVADDAEGVDAIPVEERSISDAVPVKSVPPRRRTKSSIRTVKDESNDETFETDADMCQDPNGPSRDSLPDEKV